MTYSASEIQVLDGLEHVRLRPGMYIGSTGVDGLHHLVWELIDNSVDEAMAGYASRIEVVLYDDGSCEVSDNGRGIPVDIYPDLGISAAEVVLTKLNAGGKFGGGGYKVSGGLHGVGISVVNALSSKLELTIHRNGYKYHQVYTNGGVPKSRLKKAGKSSETGTTVRFWPDADIFTDVDFDDDTIAERLQIAAYLNAGLTTIFYDEQFCYPSGLEEYCTAINDKPLIPGAVRATTDDCEIAISWSEGYSETLLAYANGVSTISGGTHAEGLRRGITSACNSYARKIGMLKPKDPNLTGEDLKEGLIAIVSVRLTNPQFEGQTKAKLGNTEVRGQVETLTTSTLEEWFQRHPKESQIVLAKAASAAAARAAARQARELSRAKSKIAKAKLPEKLVDATARRPQDRELFIVEGNSAGGTARDARDHITQAILPIRGKILNTEKVTQSKLLANAEVQSLITAIGAGIGQHFDIKKVRYHKVIILADADPDGSHIRTLLMTLFFRHMRPLVDAGMVYAAQPPLFSTIVGGERIYLKNDAEREAFLKKHPKHGKPFLRLKGLGEMDYDELALTTMAQDTRSLLQVTSQHAELAEQMFSILMGDDVSARRAHIASRAPSITVQDI
jgi:DNA gyrase subunit B